MNLSVPCRIVSYRTHPNSRSAGPLPASSTGIRNRTRDICSFFSAWVINGTGTSSPFSFISDFHSVTASCFVQLHSITLNLIVPTFSRALEQTFWVYPLSHDRTPTTQTLSIVLTPATAPSIWCPSGLRQLTDLGDRPLRHYPCTSCRWEPGLHHRELEMSIIVTVTCYISLWSVMRQRRNLFSCRT
jgi:hypothetical protein